MGFTENAKDIAHDYVKQATRLKRKVIAMVLQLPDVADDVKQLSKNCCSVSLSLIAKHGFNLSAGYYLTRSAKKQLIEMIQNTGDLALLDKKMKYIIQTGNLNPVMHQGKLVAPSPKDNVPPEFTKALKEVWCGKGVCPWITKLS